MKFLNDYRQQNASYLNRRLIQLIIFITTLLLFALSAGAPVDNVICSGCIA